MTQNKLARRSLFQGIAGVLLGRVVAPEATKAAVMTVARHADNVWHHSAMRINGIYVTASVMYAQRMK